MTTSNELNGAASHAAIPGTASRPALVGGSGHSAGANVRGGGERTAIPSATVTIAEEAQEHDEVLHLSLRARPSVRWYVYKIMLWIIFNLMD